MRLRVASCSNARRLVDVSVVVVVILRTCEPCDPDLLSLEGFRVAALAGRDCCWRRAAEARRSATEAPREGGLEAIARVVHSRSVLVFVLLPHNPTASHVFPAFTLPARAWSTCSSNFPLAHSRSDCGDRVRPNRKARPALKPRPNRG